MSRRVLCGNLSSSVLSVFKNMQEAEFSVAPSCRNRALNIADDLQDALSENDLDHFTHYYGSNETHARMD
ncbi:MAG: hypothetical protein GY750_07610 [Lentisphaerae bacterium]|nr:hypothetical protein [Lentisphaerota bacterium]MCP4101274.1 hypothetical protein [Lentisphaerota bacterium]